MLSILCPHCDTKLTVEQQWRGKTISCLSCAQQLAVPVALANVVEPIPSLVISPEVASAGRRRKRPMGSRVISVAMHLSITGATIYAGYYLLSHRRIQAPQQPIAVVEPSRKAKPAPRPRPLEKEKSTLAPEAVPETPPPVVVAAPVSPWDNLPAQVALPSSGDAAIVTLADRLSDVELRWISNSPALTHEGRKILWQNPGDAASAAVAGLAVIDEELKFRWIPPVSTEAEAAIRNSIVRLKSGDFEHVLRLGSAALVEPLQVDLNKPLQRIVSKCDWLPAVEDLRFELVGIDQLPTCTIVGADPTHLQLRDQTTLQYTAAAKVATRLAMKKRGRLVIVEVESRYVLPSGYEQPMSIARGNHKLQELDTLYQEAEAAGPAIADLRNRLESLRREARAVPRSRTTATAKSIRLGQLQNDLDATQQKISYAERLLSQKSAIEADHRAIQQVAKLAQQLHESQLAYRFFTVVDGHEVDVLVAEQVPK